MKRILAVIIIALLCFSTFSALSPQVKAESETITLPAGAWYPPGKVIDSNSGLNRIDMDLTLPGDQQVVTVSPGEAITFSYWAWVYGWGSGGYEIRQLWFAYSWASSWPPWDAYTGIYDGIPHGTRNVDGSVSITVPTTPGTYEVWLCVESHYSMSQAVAQLKEEPTMLPHAVIVVESGEEASSTTDPTNDLYYYGSGSPAPTWGVIDIVYAEISQVDSAQIRLLTRASQAIPLTNQWQSFYWLLDTGTPAPAWSNPIDVNDLTISYYIGISWGADGPLWISVNKYNNTGQYELVKEDARSHPETYFSSDACSITISLGLIGNPTSIKFVAGSSDGIVPGNIGRHDKAPDTGHSQVKVLETSSTTDPTDDLYYYGSGSPAPTWGVIDIVYTELSQVNSTHIRLLTRASQAIPLTNHWQSFYWLLDTGTPAPAWSNPIDVNDLTISYYIGISWGADGPLWISVNKYNNTGQYELVKEDARSHPETYFSGNMCSIDISLSLIGNPNSIRWVAGSSDGIVPGNIGRHDKAPETGHSTLATGAVPFGTIYIMTDGSIDPPRTPISSSDNTTYIFTNDIVSDGGIIVRRDNIKLNGAGHILRGTVADQIPGVDLNGTTNVEVENIVVREYDVGISLTYSNNCVVSGNDITASVGSYGYGIYLWHAQNSDICLNRLLGNSYGIGLDLYCTNNRFYENNMTNNGWAIVFASSDNLIYHNNFVNNGNRTSGSQQVLGWDVTNGWDDGFPSGGNYWSNYLGVDLKGGPSQNQSGSDGIGDTPFYDDRFPLMQPWVTLVGDINKDRKVSLADLVILASVYGSKLGDSNWDPNADIDGNNSIGLSDLVALAQHYGEHYP